MLAIAMVILIGCDKKIHEIIVVDYFTDSRDGNKYTTVLLGDQIWMAENLAFIPQSDSFPDISTTDPRYYILDSIYVSAANARTSEHYMSFGVSYNWLAAISACPSGWHLPSDEEWIELEDFLGMRNSELDKADWRQSGHVDLKLKSQYLWALNANGTNISSFNAVPGLHNSYPEAIEDEGRSAYFWTSTQFISNNNVWFRGLRADEVGVLRLHAVKSRGFSVRCVKDK